MPLTLSSVLFSLLFFALISSECPELPTMKWMTQLVKMGRKESELEPTMSYESILICTGMSKSRAWEKGVVTSGLVSLLLLVDGVYHPDRRFPLHFDGSSDEVPCLLSKSLSKMSFWLLCSLSQLVEGSKDVSNFYLRRSSIGQLQRHHFPRISKEVETLLNQIVDFVQRVPPKMCQQRFPFCLSRMRRRMSDSIWVSRYTENSRCDACLEIQS